MKKLSLLTASVLCISAINHNITARQRFSEEHILGPQMIRELGEDVKAKNLAFRNAVGEVERQEALKNAHMAAQTLLNTLNDIKTYGNETMRGYNPAQRKQAAINLAELITRANSINAEIENKRMEKKDMTEEGYIFEPVKLGKAEPYAQATKDLRALIAEEKSTQLAIKNQEEILGKEWSNAIKLAIQNLIVGNSYGIAYGIDWYFGDRGAKLMVEKNQSQSAVPVERKTKKSMPLTQKQKSAIKSWNHLRKNELLSKDITTAYQLTQAKELLNQLNMIKDDLQNVPVKYKYVLDRVTEKTDSLARKIDRAKTRWLK